MKNCICCGAHADAAASTCANCGEGSWSQPAIVEVEEPTVAPTVPEFVPHPIAIEDPDAATEAPRVRRNKRPN